MKRSLKDVGLSDLYAIGEIVDFEGVRGVCVSSADVEGACERCIFGRHGHCMFEEMRCCAYERPLEDECYFPQLK